MLGKFIAILFLTASMASAANWHEVWARMLPSGAAEWTPPSISDLIYWTDFSPPYNSLDYISGGVLTYGPSNKMGTAASQTSFDFWWEVASADADRINVSTQLSGNVVADHSGDGAAYSDALRNFLPDSAGITPITVTNFIAGFWLWRYENESDDRYFDTAYSPDMLIDDGGANSRFYAGSILNVADITASNWTHVAMGMSNSTLYAYINGAVVGTSTGPSSFSAKWCFSANTLGPYYAKCRLDDIFIYRFQSGSYNATVVTNWFLHGAPNTRSR